MNTYCTVVVNATNEEIQSRVTELRKLDPNANWQVLTLDNSYTQLTATTYLGIHGFKSTDFHFEAYKVFKKYRYKKKQLVKAMVPVFMRYLLMCGWEKVVYIGWEGIEYENMTDMFELLEDHSVVLIPNDFHKPELQVFPYEDYFKQGHYNANLVGASQNGMDAIRWWEEMCEFRVNVKKRQKKTKEELYHQQAYLNMLPTLFDSVYIKRNSLAVKSLIEQFG